MFRQVQIFVVLLFFAALAFGVRSRAFLEEWTGTKSPQLEEQNMVSDLVFPTPPGKLADIEPAADENYDNMEPPEMPDLSETGEETMNEAESGLGAPPEGSGTEWRDYTEADMEYSSVRGELFEDLTERRKDIESKERELAMREALLQAAEREIEQKFVELEGLRGEIEALLQEQSEEEEARIQSLVKIYEGMKAKDAARIFNTLETDVLLSVIGRMSERKSAPIIASMNPDRARSITILLAEQKKLPDLSLQ